MLCEIMPVYLLGRFGLEPAGRGFRVARQQALELGDWTARGMPFYHNAVRCRFPFDLPEPTTSLRVTLPEWQGSVIALRLDGEECGVVYPHDRFADVRGEFAAGPHELALDVVGNMRNLMGPHHAEGLPGPWTWIQCPDHMPPGSEYRRWPSGLYGAPELRMR